MNYIKLFLSLPTIHLVMLYTVRLQNKYDSLLDSNLFLSFIGFMVLFSIFIIIEISAKHFKEPTALIIGISFFICNMFVERFTFEIFRHKHLLPEVLSFISTSFFYILCLLLCLVLVQRSKEIKQKTQKN